MTSKSQWVIGRQIIGIAMTIIIIIIHISVVTVISVISPACKLCLNPSSKTMRPVRQAFMTASPLGPVRERSKCPVVECSGGNPMHERPMAPFCAPTSCHPRKNDLGRGMMIASCRGHILLKLIRHDHMLSVKVLEMQMEIFQ